MHEMLCRCGMNEKQCAEIALTFDDLYAEHKVEAEICADEVIVRGRGA